MIRKLQILFLILSLSLGSLFIGEAVLYAQEDSPAAEEETIEQADLTLLGLFQAGRWAMYPLLFLSICGVGLTIYNFLMIREKPFLRPDLLEELKPLLGNLEFDKARTLCEENPSPVTNIIYDGLERVDPDNLDPEAIKEAMEDSSAEELATPFIMINYLSIVATLSPMVGLLGTVSGMVRAFRAIAAAGMGQPQVLADNISEALITTATGLIVGIPAMFFYFFFKNRYGKIASRVSKQVGDVYYEMIRGVRRHAS